MLFGGAFVLFYPGEIFKANIFWTMHSVLFHAVMLIFGLFLVVTNIVAYKWNSVYHAFIVFVLLWIFVGAINEILWQLKQKKCPKWNSKFLKHFTSFTKSVHHKYF